MACLSGDKAGISSTHVPAAWCLGPEHWHPWEVPGPDRRAPPRRPASELRGAQHSAFTSLPGASAAPKLPEPQVQQCLCRLTAPASPAGPTPHTWGSGLQACPASLRLGAWKLNRVSMPFKRLELSPVLLLLGGKKNGLSP